MKPDYVASGGSPLDRKSSGPKQEADRLPGRSEDMQAKVAPVADGSPSGNPDQPVAGSNPAGPAKFDRVAYQREYMRKRRAAAKGKPA